MSDIGLTWNAAAGAADFSIVANDLATDDGLRTAVALSLFTDRLAGVGDVLPVGEADRRGWWADAVPVVPGDNFGSRFWLLSRSKQTPDVLSRAEEYAREALQWLLDDKVSDKITAVAEFATALAAEGITITIRRPNNDSVSYRFNHTWEGV